MQTRIGQLVASIKAGLLTLDEATDILVRERAGPDRWRLRCVIANLVSLS